MKKFLSLLVAALVTCSAAAHEGMWLLTKLKQINEAEMQKLGFKLSADDIYAINRSGLKDAVLENGIKIKVGMAINPGDRVRIDSETMEYKEREQ